MKANCFAFLAFLSSVLLTAPAPAADQQTHADIVLLNGAVYTMDAPRRWAQAVAISNGRITFVGTDQDAVKYAGPLTNVVNLKGKMVLPGFVDSHIHPIHSALDQSDCCLNDCESAECIKKTISEFVKEHPKDARHEWVIGSGWQLTAFSPQGPDKKLLDELVSDRPAYFTSQDGHSAWVNSKALSLAQVTAFTPDPKGGRIERVDGSREPAGTLREAAVDLVSHLVPSPSADERREAALNIQKKLNAVGIIGVQEACAEEPELKAYASLDDANLLTMRVSAAMAVDADKGEKQLATLKEWSKKYDGNLLRVKAAKIFADGVMETKTAAMLEPYLGGEKGDCGTLNFAPNLFKWYACKLDAAGLQIHVHAIGDRAVRATLDAIETAEKINGRSDRRHHIAHLELIDSKDINRFRELNVAANFQSFWSFRDKYVAEMTESILGPERSKHLYPVGELFKSGAVVVGGSDWSVSTYDPLAAIQVAVTRRGLTDTGDQFLLPGVPASLPEILSAYTINGAWLGHWDRESGSLETGKSADLIVLDKNLFSLPPTEIHQAKVLWTLFRGRAVYRDPNFEI
jgi:predicted amidohydrolase YtcJ